MKTDNQVVTLIKSLHSEGYDRNYISGQIFLEIQDFNKTNNLINKSKVSFKRKSGNWDCVIEFFKSDEEKSKDNLKDYMLNNLEDMNEEKVKKYISSYYYVMNEIYLINNS